MVVFRDKSNFVRQLVAYSRLDAVRLDHPAGPGQAKSKTKAKWTRVRSLGEFSVVFSCIGCIPLGNLMEQFQFVEHILYSTGRYPTRNSVEHEKDWRRNCQFTTVVIYFGS